MGHFWDGRGRLNIKYKVGDLIACTDDRMGLDDDYGIVVNIDPWFMGKKAGIQAETYSIDVIWKNQMAQRPRYDISFRNDPFKIITEAKNNA